MGKQANIGLGGKSFGNKSIQVGPSLSQTFTVSDFVRPSIARPVDPNVIPNTTSGILKPSVPGTGAPIVSNNPIQSASPYLSSLQSFGGDATPIESGKDSNEARKWKIAIIVIISLIVIYHFYNENG